MKGGGYWPVRLLDLEGLYLVRNIRSKRKD